MKKILPIFIIAIVTVGAGAFFAGTKYAQNKAPAQGRGMGLFANLSPEERQVRFQQFGASGGQRGMRIVNGFATGEIISKDEKTITVKLPDGGSKIIFYSATTEVGKFFQGTAGDLAVGENVFVNGKANDDGSVTAQSIQIRPTLPLQ